MKTLDQTYEEILEKLTMQLPFSFSRFGDGEWNCIFGEAGRNCDKHEYFTDLGARLRKIVLSKPKYMMGIQELALRGKHGADIVEMIIPLDIPWYNAEVLCKMSIYGRLAPFIHALKKRKVLLIGPKYLMGVSDEMGFSCQIIVPELNCWTQYQRVKEQMYVELEEETVAVFCAGMMSNVLIDDFAAFPRVTCLDIGSLLDPYAGKYTRAYHTQLEL